MGCNGRMHSARVRDIERMWPVCCVLCVSGAFLCAATVCYRCFCFLLAFVYEVFFYFSIFFLLANHMSVWPKCRTIDRYMRYIALAASNSRIQSKRALLSRNSHFYFNFCHFRNVKLQFNGIVRPCSVCTVQFAVRERENTWYSAKQPITVITLLSSFWAATLLSIEGSRALHSCTGTHTQDEMENSINEFFVRLTALQLNRIIPSVMMIRKLSNIM